MSETLELIKILERVEIDTRLRVVELKKVSKASYILKAEEGNFLLKTCPEWGNFAGWLSRFLIGTSIPFKTDIAVNGALALKGHFKAFSAPPLFHTDGKTYLLLHYVPGILGWDRRIIPVDTLAEGLIEFQTSALEWPRTLIEQLGGALLEKPVARIFRGALSSVRSRVGYKATWKCFMVVWKCYRSQPRLNFDMLLQNDLGLSNIVTGRDKRLYFIDFEDVIKESRWILCDIVDLSFNLNSLAFDRFLFNSYLNRLSAHVSGLDNVSIVSQVRLALLRCIIFGLMSRKLSSSSKRGCEHFLCSVMLDDKAFHYWYALNVPIGRTDSNVLAE